MKFLCDSCKTKYQIDDDKVAGKTVRMKCRKCGHLIEIRQSAGPASVMPKQPTVPLPPAPSAKPPLRAPAKPPNAPPRRPAPTRPLLANNTGAFRTQNPLSPTTQSLPRQPRPGVAPLQARAEAPSAPKAPVAAPAMSPLQDALGAGSAALESLTPSPPPAQWFVAIDGAPVGPIHEGEVQRHVAAGKVNADSLAWREGLGDWRRAGDISELAGLFAAKPKLVSGVQVRTPATQLASSPDLEEDESTRMDSLPDEVMQGARAAIEAQHVSNPFAPTRSNGKSSEPFLAQASDPFVAAADPFTASNVGPAPSGAFDTGAPSSAFGAAQSELGPARSLTGEATFEQPTKKAFPWIPLAMVLGAVAFAITAAIVLFMPKPPPPVVQQVEPPTPASTASAAPSAPVADNIPPPEPSTPVEPTEPSDPKVTKSGGGTKVTTPAASASAGGGAANLSSLLGPSGTGPSANGTGGGGGGGTGSLSQSQIEGTVRNYMPGVKKGCWDTSNAQSGDVRATITIGVSGAVQNVSTTGSDPALARCIETKVRSWKFPPPGGTQQVTVPFKFVRQ